jgi:hypothetical protein
MLTAILGITSSRKLKTQFLGSRGVKVKIIRRVEEKSLFLKVKNFHLVIFVVEKATLKQHAALSKKSMASAQKENTDRSDQWKKN